MLRKIVAAGCIAVSAAATAAHAAPMLEAEAYMNGTYQGMVSSTNGTLTNSTLGAISGLSFGSVSATGVPLLPSPNLSSINFDVTSSTASATNTLIVAITQTGLTSPLGTFPLASSLTLNDGTVGGVTSSVINYVNANNAAFGTTTQIASLSSGLSQDSSAQQVNPASVGSGPWSETEVYRIVFSAASVTFQGTDQINYVTTAVPEPASLGLLGAGLVALGFVRRRSRKIV